MTSPHIEAIARAMYPQAFMDAGSVPPRGLEFMSDAALTRIQKAHQRKAIKLATLAFTMSGEIFAGVADDSYDSDNLADRSPKHIAARIRALIQKEVG